MSCVLAFDTSASVCSVALRVDGRVLTAIEFAEREHMQVLLQTIEKLCAKHAIKLLDVDRIAFGRGPGRFTGLRISASCVQAFALALPHAALVPVSTLQALAQACAREHRAKQVLSVIDARMQEVYWGRFKADANGVMQLVGTEQVSAPQAIVLGEVGLDYGIGSGFRTFDLAQILAIKHVPIDADAEPLALDILALSDSLPRVAPELALPVYIRDNVTHQNK